MASDGSITLPPGTLEVATTWARNIASTGPVNGGGPTITIRSAHGNNHGTCLLILTEKKKKKKGKDTKVPQ